MNQDYEVNRQTVDHFPSEVGRSASDRRLQLNSYMFFEDIRLQTMPIGGRSRSFPEFRVQTDPDSPEIREQLAFIFGSSERGYRRNLEEAISQFVSDLAGRLAFKSGVIYEIGTINVLDTNRIRTPFVNSKLPIALPLPLRVPGNIIGMGPLAVQLIPRAEWKRSGRRLVLLKRNQVWKVGVPKELGGALRNKLSQRFIAETNELMPQYINRSGRNPYEEKHLNLMQFLNVRRKLLCAATNDWSWPARMAWTDQVTEYFLIERQLAFSGRLAVLLEHIICMMNEFLDKSQFRARISLSGLPSSGEVSESLSKLREGELEFEKVLDISHL